jgi:hypothetical protein
VGVIRMVVTKVGNSTSASNKSIDFKASLKCHISVA